MNPVQSSREKALRSVAETPDLRHRILNSGMFIVEFLLKKLEQLTPERYFFMCRKKKYDKSKKRTKNFAMNYDVVGTTSKQ